MMVQLFATSKQNNSHAKQKKRRRPGETEWSMAQPHLPIVAASRRRWGPLRSAASQRRSLLLLAIGWLPRIRQRPSAARSAVGLVVRTAELDVLHELQCVVVQRAGVVVNRHVAVLQRAAEVVGDALLDVVRGGAARSAGHAARGHGCGVQSAMDLTEKAGECAQADELRRARRPMVVED